MVKRFIYGVLVVFMVFTFCSCKKEEFVLDRVSVTIKSEFRQAFNARAITVDSFGWENVKGIKYETWYDRSDSGWMVVALKETGKKQVLDAIQHFNTIDFVEVAEKIGMIAAP